MSAKYYESRTKPGNTNWKDMSNGRGIYVEVDTTVAGFDPSHPIPIYVTSIGGDNQHWATTGATSIYEAKHGSFRVYIRWIDGSPLNAAFAEERNWHINWQGAQRW